MNIFFLGILADIKNAIIQAVEDVLRKFSFWLCRMLYPLISEFYDIFEIIAKHRFFTDEDIQKISNNIYTVISVIMIFALAIKFIGAIVNPDLLNDKKKGATSVLLRSFAGILLIVLIPWAFQFAYKTQNIILEKGIIQKIILGTTSKTSGGNLIGGATLSTFLTPKGELSSALSEIQTVSEWDDDHPLEFNNTFYSFCSKYKVSDVKKIGDEISQYMHSNESGTLILNSDMFNYYSSLDQQLVTCAQVYYDSINERENPLINSLTGNVKTCANNYKNMIAYNDPDIFQSCITIRDSNDNYLFNYNGVIAPIAGLYMVYEMLLLCIDIALRSIKLGLLELIAPIIICGYIYSGEILKRWVKEVVATYVLVFVKVGVVSFLVYGLSLMDNFLGSSSDFKDHRGWIRLFVIIGLLQLIKQLPSLINTIFGTDIKDQGGIKGRLGEMAGVGKLAQKGWEKLGQKAAGLGKTLAIAPVAASASRMAKKFNKLSEKDSKFGRLAAGLKRSANGRVGSVARTLYAGINSNGKNTTKALKEAWDKSALGMRNQAALREERQQKFNATNHMDKGGTRTKYGTASIKTSDGVTRSINEDGIITDNNGNSIDLNKNFNKKSIKFRDAAGNMIGINEIKDMVAKYGESDSRVIEAKAKINKAIEDAAKLHSEARKLHIDVDLEESTNFKNSSINQDHQKGISDYKQQAVRKANVQELDSTFKSFISSLQDQLRVYEAGSSEQQTLSEFLAKAQKPGFIESSIESQLEQITTLASSIGLDKTVYNDNVKRMEKVKGLKDELKLNSYDSTTLSSEITKQDTLLKEYKDKVEKTKGTMSKEAYDEINNRLKAIDVKTAERAKSIEDYAYNTSDSGKNLLHLSDSDYISTDA